MEGKVFPLMRDEPKKKPNAGHRAFLIEIDTNLFQS